MHVLRARGLIKRKGTTKDFLRLMGGVGAHLRNGAESALGTPGVG